MNSIYSRFYAFNICSSLKLIILSLLPFHSIVEWQEMISLTKLVTALHISPRHLSTDCFKAKIFLYFANTFSFKWKLGKLPFRSLEGIDFTLYPPKNPRKATCFKGHIFRYNEKKQWKQSRAVNLKCLCTTCSGSVLS